MFRWIRFSALLISLLVLAGCAFLEQLEDRFLCFAQAPLATGIVDAAASPTTTDTGVPAPTDGDFAGRVWIVVYNYRDTLAWLPGYFPGAYVPGHLIVTLSLAHRPEFPYHNLEGLTGFEWELTTTDEAGGDSQMRIMGGAMKSVQTVESDFAWPNRKPILIRLRLRNHYGWSAWVSLRSNWGGSTGNLAAP